MKAAWSSRPRSQARDDDEDPHWQPSWAAPSPWTSKIDQRPGPQCGCWGFSGVVQFNSSRPQPQRMGPGIVALHISILHPFKFKSKVKAWPSSGPGRRPATGQPRCVRPGPAAGQLRCAGLNRGKPSGPLTPPNLLALPPGDHCDDPAGPGLDSDVVVQRELFKFSLLSLYATRRTTLIPSQIPEAFDPDIIIKQPLLFHRAAKSYLPLYHSGRLCFTMAAGQHR